MVGVGVGEDYFFDFELLVFYSVEEWLWLIATIDDPAGFVRGGGAIGDDEAVCLEVAQGEGLDIWGSGWWCHVVYYR